MPVVVVRDARGSAPAGKAPMLFVAFAVFAAVAAWAGGRLDDRAERNWALVARHSLNATANALEATR